MGTPDIIERITQGAQSMGTVPTISTVFESIRWNSPLPFLCWLFAGHNLNTNLLLWQVTIVGNLLDAVILQPSTNNSLVDRAPSVDQIIETCVHLACDWCEEKWGGLHIDIFLGIRTMSFCRLSLVLF